MSTNISDKVQSVVGEILEELNPMTWELFSTSCQIINALNSWTLKSQKLKESVTLQETFSTFALLGLGAISKKHLLFPSGNITLHVKDMQFLLLMTENKSSIHFRKQIILGCIQDGIPLEGLEQVVEII